MKIAYFTDTFAPEINGVANTLARLSGYLEKKGIGHTFFAPGYNNNIENEPDLITEIKRIYRFPGARVGLSPESSLAFPPARLINNLCDGLSPDLIHVTTEFGIGFRGMKYAVSRELPLIMSSHTDYCKYLKFFGLGAFEPAVERYLKWFYGFSNKTLVPSRFTMERMHKKGFRGLGIWTRGIDTSKFNPGFRKTIIRETLGVGDRFAFLYVGRLSPEKGLDLLMHSISVINARFPGKSVFIITGDGPYAENIQKAGFDNVIMTGFRRGHELSEIYASCDCFAFPSGTETLGNTALEALASGLPVAGILGGGVTEFLTQGQNALLSADGDKDAFAQNLISIMENAALRHTLSENGLKTANKRDWDTIFDSLLQEYATAIHKNSIAVLKRVA